MLNHDFLLEFKKTTELNWSQQSLDPAGYENALGVQFPLDFYAFLQVMNGTDIPTLNVYGNCGEPHRTSVGVYSYPRDLKMWNSALKMFARVVTKSRQT